jgi:hypothetical protein
VCIIFSDLMCTQWVSVTAGLVHKKIFAAPDASIEKFAESALMQTCIRVFDELEKVQRSSGSSCVSHEFEPLENQCLDTKNSEINKHFTYAAKSPDFITAEKDRLTALRASQQTSSSLRTMTSLSSTAQQLSAGSSISQPKKTSVGLISLSNPQKQYKQPTQISLEKVSIYVCVDMS